MARPHLTHWRPGAGRHVHDTPYHHTNSLAAGLCRDKSSCLDVRLRCAVAGKRSAGSVLAA
eukprot:15447529-Alexandrium_andersonii.AAC.1